MPKVTFVTAGGEKTIEVPSGSVLLQVALNNDIHLEWGCESGSCGMCRVRVLEGEKNLSDFSDAEIDFLVGDLDEGWRLACQTRIKGDVKVEVPEAGH